LNKKNLNLVYSQLEEGEASLGESQEVQLVTSKLEQRRKEKRKNKFDRINLRQRIESVKKLRSESKALTGDLDGFKLAMEKSQITAVKMEGDKSKSIISKVVSCNCRNVIRKKDQK
jgi:ABC-type phosphate transport system auxiliary subunit